VLGQAKQVGFVGVSDLDAAELFYGGMAQDHRGTWSAPRGARVAWFSDPDGNNLSLQS